VLTSPQALALGRSLPASQFAGTLFIVLGKAVTCQWNRLGHIAVARRSLRMVHICRCPSEKHGLGHIKRAPGILGVVVGIFAHGLSRLLRSTCSKRLVGQVIAIDLVFDGFPQSLRCSRVARVRPTDG
jgi:hypothetical protein